MEWRRGTGGGSDDDHDLGFGPPRHGQHRHGQHHDDQFHDDQFHDDESARDPGSRDPGRDGRLAGFAVGGKWEKRPPSARLAVFLESLSGPQWRCPGGTEEEMVAMASRWAAVESWAGAAKLGVIRELIRREDRPWQPVDKDTDVPDPWTESLTHNLSLALAASAGSAEHTEWLAWELGTRLPGIDALLTDGTLNYGKAKAIAEAFKHLSDGDAAHAEALILGQLAGKTYMQVLRLAAMAAAKVDPGGAERRRKEAEKHSARVRLWREQSGTAALAGFDLPTDEALAAHDNVSARADHYKSSKAFPGAKLDQLRAMAYLDLLNGVTAETRITSARTPASPAASAAGPAASGSPDPASPADPTASDSPGTAHPAGPADPAAAGPADPAAAPEAPDAAPEDGPDDDGGDGGDSNSDGDGGGGDDGGGGGDGPDNNGDHSGDGDPGSGRGRPGTDLVIPLITLLGLGDRPGEAYRLGPLDPGLCRQLAALAAASPATEFCITITDRHGFAIGHGCARNRVNRSSRAAAATALVALVARVNLTIPLTDLQNLTGPASPVGRGGSRWAFTPRGDNHGSPGGHGTWTLTIPGGREFTVRLEQVPVFDCDHARESRGYQPNDGLRHLVQVRDGECTLPTCTRHARECDFEHAVPYHKGGRTCACNAGARSRKCHRIKQTRGWNVTQPKPGWHQWTTPTGHTYTQEPKRYPA